MFINIFKKFILFSLNACFSYLAFNKNYESHHLVVSHVNSVVRQQACLYSAASKFYNRLSSVKLYGIKYVAGNGIIKAMRTFFFVLFLPKVFYTFFTNMLNAHTSNRHPQCLCIYTFRGTI